MEELVDKIMANREQNGPGSRTISFEEIKEIIGSSVAADSYISGMLLRELRSRSEIAKAIIKKDGFHVEFASPCPKTFPRLRDLLGAQFEDIHLCSAEEEHDLATIVELSNDTLTECGKQAWADVLDARVQRIYTGFYGLQVELSGCSARRLADFSFMLAGQCSAEHYERWVKSDDVQQAFTQSLK